MSASRPVTSRGWTLVEVLVGLAVGLLLVSAALTWALTRVRDDARLLAQARLGTDLAAALAAVAGDLRRAGYWGHAAAGIDRASTAASAINPYTLLDAPPAAAVTYVYSRDAAENDTVDSNEEFGWRLRAGTLESRLGGSGWQAVTDPSAVRITRFTVTPSVGTVVLDDLCQSPCPAAVVACPPRIEVRTLAIVLEGRSVVDPAVSRMASTVARVRNDALVGHCGA